ncbi:MAG: NAD+ synthase [Candidatus Omnitrophica bacterium]|nr:NAD+ synthase [Candidatus Omnitrophota bacterium]
MKRNMRFAIAQIDCCVGDFEGNLKKMTACLQQAKQTGVDIIAFPELAVTGYPPEDLLLKARFIDENLETLRKLSRSVEDVVAVIGFVDRIGSDIYNAAAVIYKGKVLGKYYKMFLPNYGVFDEHRYFRQGKEPIVFKWGDLVFGVNICEDIWHEDGPTRAQASRGVKVIININASPYYSGRIREREEAVKSQAIENKVHVVYANLVGGQDELIFDGQSMIVDNNGKIIKKAEAFKEDLLIADLEIPENSERLKDLYITIGDSVPPKDKPGLVRKEVKQLDPVSEVYEALALGLRDYVTKNGFKKVVLGLSGGIDSSLVASIATDAMGKDNVIGIYMPSRYSSSDSENDAKKLAANLGIQLLTISIEQIFKISLMSLDPKFSGLAKDSTEENLQARIRGNILMALSNKFGWLVLTTGNKSEMSTGYSTLYGDMAGGLAVIKDVPKTLVYKLVKYRNTVSAVIPESVIKKEPTAELKHDQKDRDTLPPYDVLDPILKAYVEDDKGLKEIVALGFNKDTVCKVLNMVDRSEYKRRQSPPGLKITPRAFGRDRRMPVTSRYKEY